MGSSDAKLSNAARTGWLVGVKPEWRWVTIILALILAGVVGTVDYLTERDWSVSAFYLIPIYLACRVAGRQAGLALAVFCAVIFFVADHTPDYTPKYPAIPYWNAVMYLLLFTAVAYWLSAFQSAHEKLEEARALLENQNEWLEQTVRQRTAALQSEIAERKRLETAHLQAERLAMVGTMAAQVAHEVRNPLGSIKLNLDLISKEIEMLAVTSSHSPQEGDELVHEMREEVRRIQRVIEDYLKFARLPKLQSQRLKLNDFLEQKLTFMEPTFQQARVQLRTQWEAGLKTINADGEQLWQAILNLVKNSIEAMPDGGTLTVSTQRGEDREAIVRVTDTGKGMSEEQLKNVFLPFFTTKQGGTGLGLALALRILQEHGARIECASTVGKGTTFTIRFPLPETA